MAVFTSDPVVIQIFLNGEAVLTARDGTNTDQSNLTLYNNGSGSGSGSGNNNGNYSSSGGSYSGSGNILRRHRHSAGEVTCVSTEQYFSLPPDSRIEVQFHSKKSSLSGSNPGVGVQGFFMINKL